MKYLKYIIIASIFLLLLVDYNLSSFGKGHNILKSKLNYDYNTDFDPLEGFKIEQEGFMQIIGFGTEIDNNTKVNRILKYANDTSGIFCEFKDSENKLQYVKIVNEKQGLIYDNIKYELIPKEKIKNDLNWQNVFNSPKLRFLEIINIILKIVLFFGIIIWIIGLFKKKK